MLDARVYRTAFLPALLALFLAAFALQDRPTPGRSAQPADAFSTERAFGTARDQEPGTLQGLAAEFPDRAPGSAGDAALAEYVAQDLAEPWAPGQRPAFTVRRTTTANGLQTVIATRPGPSSRRIVVVADRDSLGRAELSSTAVLLELARVFKSRELRKTLVIVSTTGGRSGFEGAREWARGEDPDTIDGVIVLGDVASNQLDKPWAVGWTGTSRSVPLGLERTVQAALRRETRADPGGAHATGQWIRRALPVTFSAQGPIAEQGLPAVLISASGELGPEPDATVYRKRLRAFGRSAVVAVDALDAVGRRDAPAFEGAPSGIVTLRNVMADWSVRLLVGALLLPVLLAALDAYFRARRRHVPIVPWLGWLLVAAVPLPVAWLWLRALSATGLLDAPAGLVDPARWPAGTSGIAAVVSAVVVAGLVWFGARALARVIGSRPSAEEVTNGRRGPGAPGVEGLAVATGVWLCALVALVWLRNPYAAGLLVPAAHLWLFAASGWRGWKAVTALGLGLLVPVLAVVHLSFALELNPLELGWTMALAAMTGAGAGSMLLFAGLLASCAGVVRVLLARRRLGPADGKGGKQFATRGPLTYAGPGSLGGTESALRR
ncbi:hypothetical protein DVA67_013750 [Solirubrobacter sp. CPCC 204708]|uniref:M28 family peptidase n=1 Tax=Solirubrobacter deserti TaxID=2282478 RepID=A0ABT4RC02_9ACTN|nr:hypothetical protein [Solirubrobacter deserti]MBE2317041.1 hypothetical protein [Solirubrobacter deserti]MDA0136067.1 hypothetical protein [Solirubrobacter deserti]